MIERYAAIRLSASSPGDVDLGEGYFPSPGMRRDDEFGNWCRYEDVEAEIKRLEDHLHGCREEREAAEAVCNDAETEVARLRRVIAEITEEMRCR